MEQVAPGRLSDLDPRRGVALDSVPTILQVFALRALHPELAAHDVIIIIVGPAVTKTHTPSQ